MKRIGLILALGVVTLASGCGRQEALRPKPGASTPPKAATARVAPTPSELMTPPVEARPAREDELLTKSEERKDDYFNLPPER